MPLNGPQSKPGYWHRSIAADGGSVRLSSKRGRNPGIAETRRTVGATWAGILRDKGQARAVGRKWIAEARSVPPAAVRNGMLPFGTPRKPMLPNLNGWGLSRPWLPNSRRNCPASAQSVNRFYLDSLGKAQQCLVPRLAPGSGYPVHSMHSDRLPDGRN